MVRLLSLCLGLVALLSACGPIYETQYSMVPPTTSQGRLCVSQCQQERSLCRQTCSMSEQACRADARSRAAYEYESYVRRQTAEKKPIKKSVSDFEHSYGCSSNSCQDRCEANYRDCFGGLCGGQVIATKVCTMFCDQQGAATTSAPAPMMSSQNTAPLSTPTAPLQSAPVGNDRSLCVRGMQVEVNWKGDWYPATVTGPARADGRCPVHYDDYGREDDEAVSLKRIRPR
jgi:hypothetical protein